MTAFWGPMGWITLHSISVNYPENPNADDKAIVKKYLNLFAETISCPSCKSHFTNMYKSYTMANPNWADSRFNLFLFIARAHNTVNKRLDKPRASTVSESLSMLRLITQHKKPSEYRNNYLTYLTNNWIKEGGGEGMIQVGHVREMRKINEQYWNLRETEFSITLPEADILSPIVSASRLISPFTHTSIYIQPTTGTNMQTTPKIGFKFKGGKFSLTGR
jgi:hypothetical protein